MDAPEITPDSLPPKVVSLQARMSNRVERRMAGDFPVLEAFQQFLESERRRTRRHALFLTGMFIVASLGVASVSVFVGVYVYRHMRSEVQTVQGSLQSVQAQSRDFQARTQSQVEKVVGAARESTASRKRMEGDVKSQAAKLAAYEQTIATMRKKMADLELRNQALDQDLESVRDVIPSLSSDLGVVVNMLEQSKAAEAAAARQPTPSTEPLEVSGPARNLAITLAIAPGPGGAGASVPWRLLIPE